MKTRSILSGILLAACVFTMGAGWSASAAVIAFGQQHVALGDATLSREANGTLLIDKIGIIGEDGVRIGFGEVEAFQFAFDQVVFAGQNPDGGVMDIRAVDPQQVVLGKIFGRDIGNVYETSVDFSGAGSPTHRLRVFNGTALVADLAGRVNQLFAPIGLAERIGLAVLSDGTLCIMLMWTNPIAVDLGNGQVVQATRVMVLSETANALTRSKLDGVEYRVSHLAERRIVDESVRLFSQAHRGLGDGILAAEGNALVISNISQTAEDGVSIRFGQPESFQFAFDKVIFANQNPDGGVMDIRAVGPQPGVLGKIFARDIGNVYETSVDFSGANSPTHRLRIVNGITLVADLKGRINQVFAPVGVAEGVAVAVLSDGTLCIMLMWNNPIAVDLGNAQIVQATRVMVISETANALSRSQLDGVEYRVSHLPERRIVDENLRLFGLSHRNLGDAVLDAQPNRLIVRNLGASGRDGLSVGLDDSPAAGQKVREYHAAIEPLLLPAGATLQVSSYGAFTGTSNAALGWAELRQTPNGAGLWGDPHSAIGGSGVRVEVYGGGNFTGAVELPQPSGALGTLTDGPNGTPRVVGFGTGTGFQLFNFNPPARFISAANPPLTGDLVRLVALNPTGTVHRLWRADTTGTQLASFTVTNESVQRISAGNPAFGRIELAGSQVRLRFRGEMGFTYSVEATKELGPSTSWQTVASQAGVGSEQSVLLNTPNASAAFYRLRVD